MLHDDTGQAFLLENCGRHVSSTDSVFADFCDGEFCDTYDTSAVHMKASVATIAVTMWCGVGFRQITSDLSLGDPRVDRGRVVRDRQGIAMPRAALFETNTKGDPPALPGRQ